MAVRAGKPLVLGTGERERLPEWAAPRGRGRLALRATIVLAGLCAVRMGGSRKLGDRGRWGQ